MAQGTLLHDWTEFLKEHPIQQFGQSHDVSTFNGATGCTHTILQILILAKTGRLYSHDEISTIATYPWPKNNPNMRGLYSGGNDNEVGRVLRNFGIPMDIIFGANWRDLIDIWSPRGPIQMGIIYGYYPEDRGYVYHGIKADGKPVGFAYLNGKTQLVGAERIFHATLFAGHRWDDKYDATVAFVKEPNHGSEARPEKPGYDIIKATQMRTAYQSYSRTGRRSLAWVPTKRWAPRGA